MMYGDPQHHQHQQQQGGDFHRGPPPPPPPMMRQPSVSSTDIAPEYHQPSGPAPPLPPYDGHGDSFAAKRMRKLTQGRAVDYASTVVRYMQMVVVLHHCRMFWSKGNHIIPNFQGAMNQMVPQMLQGHFMGMNPMHSGSLPTSGAPPQVGGFPSGLQNIQGPSNIGGPPMYQQGGIIFQCRNHFRK